MHPVCPALAHGHLYVFIEGASPKKADLLRDGRYALHTFPPEQGDEEFYFDGNSLGLLSRPAEHRLMQAIDDWKRPGIDGRMQAQPPWFHLAEELAALDARSNRAILGSDWRSKPQP